MALLQASCDGFEALGFHPLHFPLDLEQIDHSAVDHALAFDHLGCKALEFILVSAVFFATRAFRRVLTHHYLSELFREMELLHGEETHDRGHLHAHLFDEAQQIKLFLDLFDRLFNHLVLLFASTPSAPTTQMRDVGLRQQKFAFGQVSCHFSDQFIPWLSDFILLVMLLLILVSETHSQLRQFCVHCVDGERFEEKSHDRIQTVEQSTNVTDPV